MLLLFIVLMILVVFAVGATLGAWWGINIYPIMRAPHDDRYAIQYREGEWLWLKDSSSREVLVYTTVVDAQSGLDRWLRQNPEYLGHCRIVQWRAITTADRTPVEDSSRSNRT